MLARTPPQLCIHCAGPNNQRGASTVVHPPCARVARSVIVCHIKVPARQLRCCQCLSCYTLHSQMQLPQGRCTRHMQPHNTCPPQAVARHAADALPSARSALLTSSIAEPVVAAIATPRLSAADPPSIRAVLPSSPASSCRFDARTPLQTS